MYLQILLRVFGSFCIFDIIRILSLITNLGKEKVINSLICFKVIFFQNMMIDTVVSPRYMKYSFFLWGAKNLAEKMAQAHKQAYSVES